MKNIQFKDMNVTWWTKFHYNYWNICIYLPLQFSS